MKNKRLILPILAFLFVSVACQLTAGMAQPTAAPTHTVQIFPTETAFPSVTPDLDETQPITLQPSATVALAAITPEMLLNHEYQLPDSGKKASMKDGKYQSGEGVDYIYAAVSNVMAFGDINADGRPDAAVVLSENMGGSGVFESLVVILNEGKGLAQGPAIPLGDRVLVQAMRIEKSRIILDLVVHGPNDPLCCPNQPQTQSYALASGLLLLTRVTSLTLEQQERSIHIENPKDQEKVSSPIEVHGSLTITPFENTLAYIILDPAGVELKTGSFIIPNAQAGSPTNFVASIPLDNMPPGSRFWLQIQELSPADGSILALESVELVIQ